MPNTRSSVDSKCSLRRQAALRGRRRNEEAHQLSSNTEPTQDQHGTDFGADLSASLFENKTAQAVTHEYNASLLLQSPNVSFEAQDRRGTDRRAPSHSVPSLVKGPRDPCQGRETIPTSGNVAFALCRGCVVLLPYSLPDCNATQHPHSNLIYNN